MPLSCEDFSSLSVGNTCISMPVPSSRYSLPSSSYRSSPYLSSSLERSYGSRTVPRTHSKATSSYSSTSSCSSYSRKSSLSDDSTVSSLISNTHNLSVREKSEIRDNATKTRNDVSNYLSRRYSHTASATLAGLELYSKYLPSNYIGSNTGKVSSAKPPLSQSDYSSSLYSISKSVRSATSPVVERASPSIGSRLAEKSYTTSTATRGSTFPSLEHQGSLKTPSSKSEDGSYSSLRSSHHQAHRSPKSGLIGLRNIGNTCFMNSVIQCLSNTKPLLEYLLGDCHLSDINTTVSSMKGALIKAFSTVVQALWRPGSDERVVNTTSLKSQIQRFAPRFMGFNQQDAQEFLRYLLEGLHEDVNRVTTKPIPILTDIDEHLSDQQKASESWKRYLRIDDSKIVDIFVGQLKSTLRCTSCGHSSVTFDPFWDLSLPIPSRTGQVRLQQCFEVFTREEILDGDEKPTCSKCEMRRKCTKSLTIQKFPKILVIHLKRFSPVERFRGKLSINVDFPVNNLDLSAYAANKGQSCAYHLYGVANHSGTSYSGHYTAYCKHPYSGEWHEYNDSRVYGISSRSVVTSEAYVLFYELAVHDYKDYLS